MQDSKDYLVLTQLKEDLQDKFNDGNRTEVTQVKIGEYMWEDFKIKPAISFQGDVVELDTEHKLMGGKCFRKIQITLDMFMDNRPDLEIHEDIYKFKDEVRQFLRTTDWTFRSGTALDEQEVVYIGGPSDPVKQARLSFTVIYKDNI